MAKLNLVSSQMFFLSSGQSLWTRLGGTQPLINLFWTPIYAIFWPNNLNKIKQHTTKPPVIHKRQHCHTCFLNGKVDGRVVGVLFYLTHPQQPVQKKHNMKDWQNGSWNPVWISSALPTFSHFLKALHRYFWKYKPLCQRKPRETVAQIL